MKGEDVYNKIKVVREEHTVRDSARILKVSTNTIQKYSKMEIKEAANYLSCVKRSSQFDIARDFIDEQVESFPKISAKKLLRKVKQKYPEIKAKVRSFRNYIEPFKEKYKNNRIRLYHPVIDRVDTGQVQVDPGEYRVKVDSSGKELKVYFVSFVFSYSRMMFVSFQDRPYNTEDFLKAHLEAFQFFGGVAKEYVYDQTKLVVIQERYREVWFNEQFHQFALKHEFLPVVCEGYDPESKGKVERSIQYIKGDFLYGDYFANIEAIRKSVIEWLDNVANNRIHATTKRKPSKMFIEEKPFLNTKYFLQNETNFRFVDKTGLISFKGNKYSVPSKYQRKQVIVLEKDNTLFIKDISDGKDIANHKISQIKGKRILNTDHYRDIRKSVDELTSDLLPKLENITLKEDLIKKIKEDNPKIVRDQLVGLGKISKKFPSEYFNEILPNLLCLPNLKVSILEDMLEAIQRRNKAAKIKENSSNPSPKVTVKSTFARSLEYYMKGIKNVR